MTPLCYAAGLDAGGPMRPRPGQEIEVDIDRAAMEGRGVGRVGELVVFVERGLPGERVRAEVVRAKKSFVEARAIEVLRASPARVSGRCVHLGTCGGCSWQELAYEAQLAAKTDLVRESLERLGNLRGVDGAPAIASPRPFHYRNKMEFSFFAGQDGAIVLGLHVPGTFDRVFDLEACHLMSESSNRIVACARRLATASGLPAYHSRRHEGFLRYLVVREAKATGQIMVNVVTNAGAMPHRAGWVAGLIDEVPAITSLVRNINTRRANIAVGESEELLHGAPEIEEQLGGLRFRIASNTFFQTNSHQVERLFEEVVAATAIEPGDEALDLYAGTGAISLFLARRAARVTGIELVPESVAMAEKNAELNGIRNCHFIRGEVRDFFGQHPADAHRARVVVVDPPRAGLHPDVVQSLLELRVARLVYVSCNPATLARDAALLCRDGAY